MSVAINNLLTNIVLHIKNVIPKKYNVLFSIIFFLIAITGFYKYAHIDKHLEDRPCSVHVWAQCARASIALNYYKGDMNFFKPKIHKFLKGEGVTGLEFPLVNYVPAILYKLFGFNEKYYRGFVLFTMTIGLLFFFLLLNERMKNWVVSFGLTLSAFCSPVFLYYSINFMPDITSLAFALIAWHFFFKFLNSEVTKRGSWILFCLFSTLAALIKVTSLVVIFTVIVLIVLDYLKFFKDEKRDSLFKRKPMRLMVLLGCLALVYSWYLYSSYLAKSIGSESFAMQTALVNDFETAKMVWHAISNNHRFEYYPYETYILILSIIGILVIAYKLINRVILTTTLIATLGNASVAYFFFYQFKDHDYYIITLTSSVFLLYYVFADILSKLEIRISKVITLVFIFVLIFNLKESMIYSKRIFNDRLSKDFIPYFDSSTPFNDLEPKLRKLGIERTDRTLCGFDPHWCASLYKMDQLGYTFSEGDSSDFINELMNNSDFKYLILTDTITFNKLYPNQLRHKIIGSHRGLLIYKLR